MPEMNEVFLFLTQLLASIWAMWEVQLITYHVLVNFVVAVAVAIAIGEFRTDKLVDVFYRKLLPLVMVYAVIKFAGYGIANAPDTYGFGALIKFLANSGPTFVLGAIELLLITDLANNLVLIPGLDKILDVLPSYLSRIFVKTSTVEVLVERYLDELEEAEEEAEADC